MSLMMLTEESTLLATPCFPAYTMTNLHVDTPLKLLLPKLHCF